MISTNNYSDFFAQVFKRGEPFDYQKRLATDESLPDLLDVPTGAGKTAAVLGAWLYRRLHKPETVGRRLIYCLPMRTLVEQTRQVAETALRNLNAAGMLRTVGAEETKDFPIHVLLGGDVNDDFESQPEREAIIIGTQDMLLSRALNRGYAMSRYKWAVHFGLLNNDCWWVFDEVQLFADGLATTAQLAAFREKFGTFGNVKSLWMSATLDEKWLATVDFKPKIKDLKKLELDRADLQSEILARRLNAVKVLQKADSSCRAEKGLAEFIKAKHETGMQTLIVVNTVKRAQEVYRELEKAFGLNQKPKPGDKNKTADSQPKTHLLHSRFRGLERHDWQAIFNPKTEMPVAGRIIVATQVVEAGVDISSKLLVTDVAPFSSLVQRFGRCNREGEHERAEIFWIEPDEKNPKPYELEELRAAIRQLAKLESASPADLQKFAGSDDFERQNYEPAHVLRQRDLIDLFDTTADLSGFDLDISRFVRGVDERDVSLFWRENVENTLKTLSKTKLKKELAPKRDELCAVPIGEIKGFLTDKARAWIFDSLDGVWKKVEDERNLHPGQIVLLDANTGGYDAARGWEAKSKNIKVEVFKKREDAGDDKTDAANKSSELEDYDGDESTYKHYAQTLIAHSLEVRAMMQTILDDLKLPEIEVFKPQLLETAQHHDWGKAHDVFQQTLHGIETAAEFELLKPLDQVLAKSKPIKSKGHSRRKFRHELASALALLQSGATDLTVYLAACHHGKVRLSIRAMPDETPPQDKTGKRLKIKFARGIWEKVDVLPATDLGGGLRKDQVTLDLEPMLMGSENGEKSWLERMIALRDRADLGVFRLAFLESLIRAADVRASQKTD